MRILTRSPSIARSVAAALLAPAAALGIALGFGSDHLAAATALALLGVVIAAAVGGRIGGIAASFVAFLGLNFFFTEPLHTLQVSDATDLAALLAFLLSALIVGALLSRVVDERARAERRATEAHFLNQTTTRLISGEPFDQILEGLSGSLLKLFELDRCEISTPRGTGAASVPDVGEAGPSVVIPLATQSGSFGTLSAHRRLGAEDFAPSDVALLRTLANQTALAIERAALDEEVREARVDAETSELRAALFSSVTHDLKTPLSSIKASASGLLAEGGHFTEAQREEMLRAILEESDHLNQIVSNLLDLARVRAGALIPAKQPVLIEDVLASVLRRMKRALEGVAVRTAIRPELPPVDADPVQVAQLLSNLLENAIRFSPPGGEISISAARWEDAVQVRVTDHGPGIPSEDRTRVFEEFYQRDVGSERGGSGLGLAIARAVALAHGGSIRAESAPGGGTTIVFELPISTAPSGIPDPSRAAR